MKQYIFIIITIFFLSACDDFLEIQPKGKIIPTTLEDYRLMLYDYNNLKIINGDIFIGDDDVYYDDNFFNNTSIFNQSVYFWNKDIYTEATINHNSWTLLYQSIYHSNLMIEGISKLKNQGIEEKNIIAAAKAKRALCYYFLTNLYAKQYNKETANKDLSVYIIEKADLNASTGNRKTVLEVYNFILADLEYAIKNLKEDKVNNNAYFNKAAAYALRSRVNLFMRNYDKAKQDADAALSGRSVLQNFNDFEINIKSHGSFKWLDSDAPRASKNDEYYSVAFFTYTLWGSNLPCTPTQKDLFEDSDIRKIQFIESNGKWAFNAITNASLCCSVPEMLLIRAECEARNGTPESMAKALNDLNLLRTHRHQTGTPALDIVNFNKNSLLSYVLAEKRRELMNKGHRWFELKRLNIDTETQVTLSKTVEGVTKTLAPNAKNYVMPIPYNVMSYNQEHTNNPRD